MRIPFGVHSYQARALPLSAQRMVNMYAEPSPPDAKDQVVVYGCPGIKAFAGSVGTGIRPGGMHVMDGVLYVVSGNTLYSVDSAGAETSLGTINTSSGSVSIEHNAATINQMCIVDGADGWIYDTTNGLQQITDASFAVADVVTEQDGYFIFNEAGSGRFFISNLLDGLTYDATDFATAEGRPDDLVAVISNHREVWLFGTETTEVWFNSGDTNFPFDRIQGSFLERGCAAAHSLLEEDNTLIWLGDDRIIYRAAGYTPQRVSTHAVEEAIRDYDTISDAHAFVYTIGGHKVYVLTFPTEQRTWAYDLSSGLWHERESYQMTRWRVSGFAEAYGKLLVGDAFQGRVGELDLDTYEEWAETLQGSVISPPIHQDRRRVFHHRLEVDMESGTGLTTGQGSDPLVWLDWSDDGGRTWSVRKPTRSIGKIGAYRQRLIWRRLGQARERVYRLTVADPVKRSILAANAELSAGLA